jgi:hypothetical protein
VIESWGCSHRCRTQPTRDQKVKDEEGGEQLGFEISADEVEVGQAHVRV